MNQPERIQKTMDKMVEMLQTTGQFAIGKGYNGLKELRVIENERDQFVRPVFEDGNGENGYYDVNITCDNELGAIIDVMKQFVIYM